MHPPPESTFLTDLNENIGIVHRVCRAYFFGDADEREDVFQEIMYQLWKSYPRFRGESKISTWMYTVALQTAMTHVRRSRRKPPHIELTERSALAADMNEQMHRDEEVHLLYEAIETLSDVDKAIIASRVRKEFKTVGGYVWAAIVYQIILYSFLTHTLVRNWGNMNIVLLCCAGVGLCSRSGWIG
jgi:RNA polymerase sigma factor (sigma-70 family)